jgi:hypothetical protein
MLLIVTNILLGEKTPQEYNIFVISHHFNYVDGVSVAYTLPNLISVFNGRPILKYK